MNRLIITKLIDSIEKGIGVLYEPKGIVKKAKAEANAEIIKKVSQLISKNLDINVLSRIIAKENKRQINIEKIIEGFEKTGIILSDICGLNQYSNVINP